MYERERLEKLVGVGREIERRRIGGDFMSFIRECKPNYKPSWFHHILADKLDKVAKKEILRLMIWMPPRYGKTEQASRMLPAYIYGRDPTAHIIAASYADSLASRNNRDVQRIINAAPYQRLFPETKLKNTGIRSRDSNTYIKNNTFFEVLDHGGSYRSVGVDGGISGMGGDFLFLDDPIKGAKEANSPTYRDGLEEWFDNVFYLRREPDTAIVIIMTRWHEDDLCARLIEKSKADPKADKWEVVQFPAIRDAQSIEENPDGDPRTLGQVLWPEKFSLKDVESTRATVTTKRGSRTFQALFQQRPIAKGSAIIKRHWFRYYTELPPRFDLVLQSWDLAYEGKDSSSYCVGQVWGFLRPNFYWLDEFRDKMDFPDQIRAILSLTSKWPQATTKLIEKKATATALISMVESQITGIQTINPTEDKEARLLAASPPVEAGNVWLPSPTVVSSIEDWVDEVVKFRKGKIGDRPDAFSQMVTYITGKLSGEFTEELAESGTSIVGGMLGQDNW